MKKVFIGLLIMAAGAALFFLLKKQNQAVKRHIQKDLLVGKWKPDSLNRPNNSKLICLTGSTGMIDSNRMKYEYEFTEEGSVGLWLKDSLTKDITRYEWTDEDQLAFKEIQAGKATEVFNVSELCKDSLLLTSRDSITLLFTRAR